MPLAGRLFANDEDLGKKDDDHRPNSKGIMSSSPRPWRGPRRRRILLVIIGLAVLYLFFKNLPTDLPPVSQRTDPRFPRRPPPNVAQSQPPAPPKGAPPRTPRLKDDEKHYFEGPIKFYNLAATLHLVYALMGHRVENRNVLFAVSSLKSASSLIPLACEMTRRSSNNVHFLVMGRDDIPIDAVKAINGVSEEDCSALKWHDGRPDYSAYSTDYRMQISVKAGLAHVNTFMHPQAVIIDESGQEDDFFPKSIKAKAADIGVAIIGLPSNAAKKLMWITTLDSNSLKQWNNVGVDILIHAPPASSGSLIRLLGSIEKADYFGSPLPSLTIELPTHVDNPTTQFLGNLRWPPHSNNEPPNSKVTIRHRIPSAWMSPVEASIRTIEAFYPKIPWTNHVLVLSPQAELSPLYFHYLKYVLLEYRYSSTARIDFNNLAGIALNLPATHLNGSAPFEPPKSTSLAQIPTEYQNAAPSHFLWQAPNSDATLYFGEKWVELHKFVSDRFTAQRMTASKRPRSKLVSQNCPAWMEYLLELMRAKGYFVLYPAFSAKTGSSFVTMHNELHRTPEEFSNHPDEPPSSLSKPNDNLPEDPFTPHPIDSQKTPEHAEAVLAQNPSILGALSSSPTTPDTEQNPLPSHEELPLLTYKGEQVTTDYADVLSRYFASDFSLEIGGCKDPDQERLFCLRDEEEDEKSGKNSDVPDRNDGFINDPSALEMPPTLPEAPLPGVHGMKLTSTTTSVLPTGLIEVAPGAVHA